MHQERSDLLREVAGQTLEQLAFIFSFPDDRDATAIWDEETTGCHITFNGPLQGELLLMISNAALPELASNMLGLDEEETPPAEQQNDALQEALNVICGNLLPKIGGTEAVFDIQAPKILEAGAAKTLLQDFEADPQGCASACLSLDEGECQLYLRLKSDA